MGHAIVKKRNFGLLMGTFSVFGSSV